MSATDRATANKGARVAIENLGTASEPEARHEMRAQVVPDRQLTVSRSTTRRGPPTTKIIEARAAALAKLGAQAEQRAQQLADEQWVLPLETYRITATFGQSSYLWSTVHTGIDLATATGTPIGSVGRGVVTSVGYDGSYGNKVVLLHPDGTETWYAHMNTIDVSLGEEVAAGEQVGTVGSTGNVTGPHLHLEVRPLGLNPVDPSGAFSDRGLSL